MKQQDELSRLQMMLRLRERDVERLQTEVASKRRQQSRYRRNIERMNELCGQSGASAAASVAAMALNCASYKGSLMQLMASQQQDLALCDADVAITSQALREAALRREVMIQARNDTAAKLNIELVRREQKHADEFAGQAWWRGQNGL